MIHLAFSFYLLCKRVETQLFLLLPRAPARLVASTRMFVWWGSATKTCFRNLFSARSEWEPLLQPPAEGSCRIHWVLPSEGNALGRGEHTHVIFTAGISET